MKGVGRGAGGVGRGRVVEREMGTVGGTEEGGEEGEGEVGGGEGGRVEVAPVGDQMTKMMKAM